jgi:hypothetical protein
MRVFPKSYLGKEPSCHPFYHAADLMRNEEIIIIIIIQLVIKLAVPNQTTRNRLLCDWPRELLL